jgi:hypothetical protein
MSLLSLLRSGFRYLRRTGAVHRPTRARRLALEVLEDRLALSPYMVQGATLTVNGTAGNDTLYVTPGPVSYQVSLNANAPYYAAHDQIHSIVFKGNGGTDRAVLDLTFSSGCALSLHPNRATFQEANDTLTLTGIQSISAYGRANQSVNLYGGFTTNTFLGKPTFGEMSGSGYDNVVNGFGTVLAHGGSSSDVAVCFGSTTSTNWFGGTPSVSSMAGNGYEDLISGFFKVEGLAGTSSDQAWLYGATSARNTFVGTPGSSKMTASGYQRVADGFHSVVAYAGTSSDQADLSGSTKGFNTFAAWAATNSDMAGPGYDYEVRGFAKIEAHAGTAADVAQLFGPKSPFNTFTAGPTSSALSGKGYQNIVDGFGAVYAYAGNPGDVAYFTGSTTSANHFIGNGSVDSSGYVSAHATSTFSHMYGKGYHNWAYGFGYVSAQAATPADDAVLTGLTTSRNTFTATPTYCEMGSLKGDVIFARGFKYVVALPGTPADSAIFYTSHLDPPHGSWCQGWDVFCWTTAGGAWGPTPDDYFITWDGFGSVTWHQV